MCSALAQACHPPALPAAHAPPRAGPVYKDSTFVLGAPLGVEPSCAPNLPYLLSGAAIGGSGDKGGAAPSPAPATSPTQTLPVAAPAAGAAAAAASGKVAVTAAALLAALLLAM